MAEETNSLLKALGFFRSVWGVLTTATVLFPTAAAFLQLPGISDSVLKGFYSAAATTFGVLAVIMLITLRTPPISLHAVRRLAVISLAVGATCFFGFVLLKTSFLYYDSRVLLQNSDGSTSLDAFTQHFKNGQIGKRSQSHSRGGLSSPNRSEDTDELKTSPLEVLALAIFTLTIVGFSLAFSSLALYHFDRDEAMRPKDRAVSGSVG